jgi:imidazolonepropionase-like amidohydrolase
MRRSWTSLARSVRIQEAKARDDEISRTPGHRFHFEAESLLSVVAGRLPLKIHAHRQDDILTAVRICNEFGLTYTLEHVTEGHLIADVLYDEYVAGLAPGRGTGNREAKGGRLLGVVVGPIIGDRSKPELPILCRKMRKACEGRTSPRL